MASGTIKKAFEPKLFKTLRYSGTTTSDVVIASITLPKGKYLVFETGYSSLYGGNIIGGYGWIGSSGTITLSADTTLSISTGTSTSETWTGYSACFLQISD